MKISVASALWIKEYLSNSPQAVTTGADIKSETRYTNTCVPQGAVLSPFLFSLYTVDCRSKNCKNALLDCKNALLVKFADDTGLTGQITDDVHSHYRQPISDF